MKRKFDMKDNNIRAGVIGVATWFALAIICLVIADRFLSQSPIWNNALHLVGGLFLGGMCSTIYHSLRNMMTKAKSIAQKRHIEQ